MQSSPGSPFQRRPTSSKNNPDTFSSFCAVHPPPNHMRMRTRNDEEFFGSGFRRSSSLRRSSNNNGKTQYIRIIFSAFKSLFVCLFVCLSQAKYRKYYTVLWSSVSYTHFCHLRWVETLTTGQGIGKLTFRFLSDLCLIFMLCIQTRVHLMTN